MFDLSDLRSIAVRSAAHASGRQRSANGSLADVHEYSWQPARTAQRVQDLAPLRPTLCTHQLGPYELDSIQASRVEDCATVRETLSALGVSSSSNGQPDSVFRGAAHDACDFLGALRRRHSRGHARGHSAEVVGVRLPVLQFGAGEGSGYIVHHYKNRRSRREVGSRRDTLVRELWPESRSAYKTVR